MNAPERSVDALLKPIKTFRLAVSGDVFLTELECRIIDTPEYQRLRRLKQLGLTYLVYPSAVHTRFEHSIGTLSVVEKMIASITASPLNAKDEGKVSSSERLLARLLGLLHDIGNVPFGHTLEDEFGVLQQEQESEVRIRRGLGSIARILSEYLDEGLVSALMKLLCCHCEDDTNGLPGDLVFIYDIVKNTVCADLLDYLRRDPYYCNIPLTYGDRFLSYLYLACHDQKKRLVVRLFKERRGKYNWREDILSELVQLLQTRYYLAERVYFHPAKCIASSMLAWIVKRVIDEKLINEDCLVRLGDEELFGLIAAGI